MEMKKAGIGAILGAAILASAQVAEAAPQQNAVVIPYFSSARGMFTAITYVVNDAGGSLDFSYTYKLDLTQNIDQPCEHFDSSASASPNDLNTFIVDGAAPDIKNDVFDGQLGVGVSPIASAEGFVAIRNTAGTADNPGNIVAEAHIVVTPLRGVFSLRALQLNLFQGTDANGNVIETYSFVDADTLTAGQNTTVMFYPDYIADTYLYLIADTPDGQIGAGVFTARPYDLPAEIEIVHHNGQGIFNRAEDGRSAGGLNGFNCAAVVHIRDILGEAAYNWVANSGGWFSLGVPETATAANVMPYKIELAPGYGATITPLTPKTYAR